VFEKLLQGICTELAKQLSALLTKKPSKKTSDRLSKIKFTTKDGAVVKADFEKILSWFNGRYETDDHPDKDPDHSLHYLWTIIEMMNTETGGLTKRHGERKFILKKQQSEIAAKAKLKAMPNINTATPRNRQTIVKEVMVKENTIAFEYDTNGLITSTHDGSWAEKAGIQKGWLIYGIFDNGGRLNPTKGLNWLPLFKKTKAPFRMMFKVPKLKAAMDFPKSSPKFASTMSMAAMTKTIRDPEAELILKVLGRRCEDLATGYVRKEEESHKHNPRKEEEKRKAKKRKEEKRRKEEERSNTKKY
jgi:hypothetical protein